MKMLDSGLAEHIAGGVTTLCRCWRLERKDGTVLGFTDHDRDITFDGRTYAAASGFTASAIQDNLGLAVSNLDAQGALVSGKLTEDDLYAGKWDGASVIIYLVNWHDASQHTILRSGFLGEVSRGSVAFTAEMRGLTAPLDQSAGRIFQRRCPWDLGDSRCTVALGTSTHHGNGTVTQVFGAFDLEASGLGNLADGWLSRGTLKWATGANAGLSVEVRTASGTGDSQRLSLFLPMAGGITVGDTFTATVGCDKTMATCRDRYNNVVNFGGFPTMPGNDFALSYPIRGGQNDGGTLS